MTRLQTTLLVCALALGACGTSHGLPDDGGTGPDRNDGSNVMDAGAIETDARRPTPDSEPGHDANVSPDAISADAGRQCAYGGGCDLLAQDCSLGQACVPGSSASTCIAITASFPSQIGGSCAGASDCTPGTVCLASSDTCERLACAPDDCSLPFWSYLALDDGSGMPLPSAIGVCLPEGDCTPIPNDCPAGFMCWPFPDLNRCIRVVGTQTFGALCDISNQCAAGLSCYSGSCRPLCRRDVPSDCTIGFCADVGLPRGFRICVAS